MLVIVVMIVSMVFLFNLTIIFHQLLLPKVLVILSINMTDVYFAITFIVVLMSALALLFTMTMYHNFIFFIITMPVAVTMAMSMTPF